MGAHQHTPPLEHSSSDGGIRKRVCKACDRCRLKKSKCDGSSPCGRCKVDNAICVFGERKKSQDKVYPKGYVEMLEQQQGWLTTGIQELYKRSLNGQGWLGAPLAESSGGSPLTHDILERLGALKHDGHNGSEMFEEDLTAAQQRLIASGAGFMQRTESTDGSDSPRSPLFETVRYKQEPFTDPYTINNNMPPTPPDNGLFPYGAQQSSASFPTTQFAQPTPRSSALNPAMLQQQTWSQPMLDFDDNMNFINRYESPADLDFIPYQIIGQTNQMNTINPGCLPVKDFGDPEGLWNATTLA